MALILFILAAAAAIWGLIFYRAVGMLGVCLLVLVAGCCFSYPYFHLNAGPIPLTADRGLLALALGLYFFYRPKSAVSPKPWGRSEWILAAWAAVLTWSALAFDWRTLNNAPLSRLLFFYMMPTALYFLARHATLNERATRIVLLWFVAFGVYLAFTAIAETCGWRAVVFPRYIVADLADAEFLGRGRGPFLNPVGCGLWICACLAATLACWPGKVFAARPAILAISALALAGALATLTRSVWLAAAAISFVFAAMACPPRHRGRLVMGTVVLGVLSAVAVGGKLNAFKRDKDVSVHDMSQSASLRPIFFEMAMEMFSSQPLAGCGLGRYREASKVLYSEKSDTVIRGRVRGLIQHNVFLSLLTETGLIGLSGFVLLLGSWARTAWDLWTRRTHPLWARRLGWLSSAVGLAYCVNGMFHDVSVIAMCNMLLFFVAGLASGAEAQLALDRAAQRRCAAAAPNSTQAIPTALCTIRFAAAAHQEPSGSKASRVVS